MKIVVMMMVVMRMMMIQTKLRAIGLYIPAVWKERQQDHEQKSSLSCIERPSLKTETKASTQEKELGTELNGAIFASLACSNSMANTLGKQWINKFKVAFVS